jgi:hypothetical protein
MLRSPALHSWKNCVHLEHPGLSLLVSHPLAYYQDHQEGVLRRP